MYTTPTFLSVGSPSPRAPLLTPSRAPRAHHAPHADCHPSGSHLSPVETHDRSLRTDQTSSGLAFGPWRGNLSRTWVGHPHFQPRGPRKASSVLLTPSGFTVPRMANHSHLGLQRRENGEPVPLLIDHRPDSFWKTPPNTWNLSKQEAVY